MTRMEFILGRPKVVHLISIVLPSAASFEHEPNVNGTPDDVSGISCI